MDAIVCTQYIWYIWATYEYYAKPRNDPELFSHKSLARVSGSVIFIMLAN